MTAFKDYLQLTVFRTFKCVITILPRRLCLAWGKTIGLTIYHLDRRHRRIALSNLEIAFGKDLPLPDRKKIALRTFMNFGSIFMDIIKFSRLPENRKAALIHVQGEENMRAALREKKGVLLFSAHYGGWEFVCYVASRLGILNAVARPLDNKLLEKELFQIRTQLGAKIIYKQPAARQILHSLRKKEIVIIAIDQNVQKHEAVFVDFFGRTAATTPGLATFFLRTKSPIVPFFCYPTPHQHYTFRFLEPLHIELEGDASQRVLKITQICTKIIEAQIRTIPEYWFWMHNRWKTKPEPEKEYESKQN